MIFSSLTQNKLLFLTVFVCCLFYEIPIFFLIQKTQPTFVDKTNFFLTVYSRYGNICLHNQAQVDFWQKSVASIC